MFPNYYTQQFIMKTACGFLGYIEVSLLGHLTYGSAECILYQATVVVVVLGGEGLIVLLGGV